MRTDIASGGSSTTLARISGCPDSTAASTAKRAASWSNGTPRVASRIGRPAIAVRGVALVERGRLSVTMLFGVKLPPGQAPNAAAKLPAPPRHVHQEPGRHHDRKEEDERGRDKNREQAEHEADAQRDTDDREAETSHLAQQTPVLLGRNLRRVPVASAPLAPPPFSVGHLSHFAALAADRDRRSAHRNRLYGRIRRGEGIAKPS